MATKNHHHHPPKLLYQEACVTDRKTYNYPTDDYNSDNFDDEHHPICPEKAVSKPTVSTRKLPAKSHQRYQRPITVGGKSLPVNIPDWSNGDHVDDDGGGDEWLPPHEYLARIRGASFSVHEGVGRTLKGRDLRRLRNAIWMQTGFELD